MILDLHGKTVHQAWLDTNRFIEEYYYKKTKKVTIITGRSGQICDEFSSWMSVNVYVRTFSLNENLGSWTVRLKKSII